MISFDKVQGTGFKAWIAINDSMRIDDNKKKLEGPLHEEIQRYIG